MERRAFLSAAAVVPTVMAALALARLASADFHAALARYRELRAISDAMPLGHPDEDAAIDAYCEAMDHLIERTPSPNGEALALKTEMARARFADDIMFEEYMDAFLADARRLGGPGA